MYLKRPYSFWMSLFLTVITILGPFCISHSGTAAGGGGNDGENTNPHDPQPFISETLQLLPSLLQQLEYFVRMESSYPGSTRNVDLDLHEVQKRIEQGARSRALCTPVLIETTTSRYECQYLEDSISKTNPEMMALLNRIFSNPAGTKPLLQRVKQYVQNIKKPTGLPFTKSISPVIQLEESCPEDSWAYTWYGLLDAPICLSLSKSRRKTLRTQARIELLASIMHELVHQYQLNEIDYSQDSFSDQELQIIAQVENEAERIAEQVETFITYNFDVVVASPDIQKAGYEHPHLVRFQHSKTHWLSQNLIHPFSIGKLSPEQQLLSIKIEDLVPPLEIQKQLNFDSEFSEQLLTINIPNCEKYSFDHTPVAIKLEQKTLMGKIKSLPQKEIDELKEIETLLGEHSIYPILGLERTMTCGLVIYFYQSQ